MPRLKDIQGVLVGEKAEKGYPTFDTRWSVDKGWNACRTEQGKRMVCLSEKGLEKALRKGHRQYMKAGMCGEWNLIGFMKDALINAEHELIVRKEKVSDNDLCHGEDKFVPDEESQNER